MEVGTAATPLDDARRNVGRDILAGESGLSALDRYTAYIDRELQRLHGVAAVPTSMRDSPVRRSVQRRYRVRRGPART